MRNPEGGSRPSERWWSVETVDDNGEPMTADDATWYPFSSVVTSSEPDPDIPQEARIGVGNIDPVDKVKQQENHSATFNYHLERFPVAADGSPQDPFGHAVLRTELNELASTLSVLEVERNTLVPSQTINTKYFEQTGRPHASGSTVASTQRDTRKAFYAYGGQGEEPAASIDPSDSGMVTVELPFQFKKSRTYQIDQPAGEYLAFRSTDAADTDVSVTFESLDGSVSETLATDDTDGTTLQQSATSFPDLRCVEVEAETAGTIEVYVDTSDGDTTAGPAAGELLSVVYGEQDYDGAGSDEGVPAIGTGSFGDGSSLTGKQYSLNTELLWLGGRAGQRVTSTTFTVSNEVGDQETQHGISVDKSVDGREVTAESTVFGQTESHDKASARARGVEGELRCELTGGDFVLPRAYISDGGYAERSEEQSTMNIDTTFRGIQPEAGGAAIELVNAADL